LYTQSWLPEKLNPADYSPGPEPVTISQAPPQTPIPVAKETATPTQTAQRAPKPASNPHSLLARLPRRRARKLEALPQGFTPSS
ncbi:hypothetical protein ACQP3D_29420, partial [Escherichia coli]